jgi:TPP-dependent pyruvate/acetoin dehydrogenase alpha subunit
MKGKDVYIPTAEQQVEMLHRMLRIRYFEEKAIDHYRQRLNRGPLHCYIGEEACATAACMALEKGDFITSTHRGHGHCIAMGGEPRLMLAEFVGRKIGYCKGKGGSMHIADLELGVIAANGIVGGGIPISVGAGIAMDNRNQKNVILCFFGDGASNTGSFHESLNMASIWNLPVIYLLENNYYAISGCAKDLIKVEDVSVRSVAYGIPGFTVDGNDVFEIYDAVKQARDRAVAGEGPTLIEAKTYRWCGHWISDPIRYRTQDELDKWKKKRLTSHLVRKKILTNQDVDQIETEERELIEEAERFAIESPDPDPEEALEDVFTSTPMKGGTR